MIVQTQFSSLWLRPRVASGRPEPLPLDLERGENPQGGQRRVRSASGPTESASTTLGHSGRGAACSLLPTPGDPGLGGYEEVARVSGPGFPRHPAPGRQGTRGGGGGPFPQVLIGPSRGPGEPGPAPRGGGPQVGREPGGSGRRRGPTWRGDPGPRAPCSRGAGARRGQGRPRGQGSPRVHVASHSRPERR